MNQQDQNAAAIVAGLRDRLCSVDYIETPFRPGCPDIIVGVRFETYLFEIKKPLGPKGGKRGSDLSTDQRQWHREWRGRPVDVIRSLAEALAILGLS